MISMHHSLHSKNTSVRTPSLTAKSPCRSPHCRFNSTCSRTAKTRRLWHNANHYYSKPTNKLHSLSIPHAFHMRHNHNQLYLLTSNRPKILNRLFISKSYSTCNRSNHNSNPLKLHRATALIIAHGLTSSILFCLANTNYERVHSRTIILARGLQTLLPLIAT